MECQSSEHYSLNSSILRVAVNNLKNHNLATLQD